MNNALSVKLTTNGKTRTLANDGTIAWKQNEVKINKSINSYYIIKWQRELLPMMGKAPYVLFESIFYTTPSHNEPHTTE